MREATSSMEDHQQSFAVFVFKVLMDRSAELGRQWAEHAELAVVCAGSSTGGTASRTQSQEGDGAGHLVQLVLGAAAHDAYEQKSLIRVGTAIGVEAHRNSLSLHLMLKELDLLSTLLLDHAEEIAREAPDHGTGRDGLLVSRRITEVTSQLRLAAVTGYTQAISDELRQRYRTIRHDLRNPLGTIKSAVALLTDETMPVEMHESRRVRAMVVRNTSSLDQLINEVLGDTAAQLRAFDTPPATDVSPQPPLSAREEAHDIAQTRERPDLESGSL